MSQNIGTVPTDTKTNYLADNPAVLSHNQGTDGLVASTTFGPMWTLTGVGSVANEKTDPLYPGIRAFDGFGSVAAIMVAGTHTTPYFNWKTITEQTASSDAGDFDWRYDTVIITGHNFVSGLRDGGNDAYISKVELQTATSADFTTALKTFYTWTITSGDYAARKNYRLAAFDLDSGGGAANPEYTSGEIFWRLKLTVTVVSGSVSAQWRPKLGEVWMGQRLPFRNHPNLPYSDLNQQSTFADMTSQSGLTTRYLQYGGQQTRELRFTLDQSSGRLLNTNSLINWYSQSDRGTKAGIWCENPLTAPEKTIIALNKEGSQVLDWTGPQAREGTLRIVEQPPFQSSEEV